MIVDISKDDVVVTGLYQYDYGQTMHLSGCEVMDGTEVHFFQGDSGCRVDVSDQLIEIPNYFLASSKTILAYLYVQDQLTGKTVKRLTLLVLPREKPPDYIDPNKPEDFTRLLPLGGREGEVVGYIDGNPVWINLNDNYATDNELAKVAATIPQFASMKEIEDMLNKED